MNCKQGDLAIVVKTSGSGANLGKIVRCVRMIGGYRGWRDVWETDIVLMWRKRGRAEEDYAAPDECLTPIRGDLLDEETEQTRELVYGR